MKNKKEKRKKRLGIDLGNTLILKVDGRHYIQDGAMRVIKRLMEKYFGQEVYVVSKVTPVQEVRARDWLKRNGFFELLGIPKTHLYFCAARYQKGPICRRLGITHFIDDRPQVLFHMDPGVVRFLFNPTEEDLTTFKREVVHMHVVSNWSELESHSGFWG